MFAGYRNVYYAANRIAKLDTTSGAIDSGFHPLSSTGGFNGDVNWISLSSDGSTLLVGGSFPLYRNQTSSYMSTLNTSSGASQ